MDIKEKIVIVLFFLMICYLFYSSNNTQCNENFTSKYALNPNIYQGHKRDGNDLLDDSLFRDIIVYNNDEDPYQPGGRLGIDKCLDDCSGKCIEFGITGVGYCFPK